jgi:hypothetical protein
MNPLLDDASSIEASLDRGFCLFRKAFCGKMFAGCSGLTFIEEKLA